MPELFELAKGEIHGSRIEHPPVTRRIPSSTNPVAWFSAGSLFDGSIMLSVRGSSPGWRDGLGLDQRPRPGRRFSRTPRSFPP